MFRHLTASVSLAMAATSIPSTLAFESRGAALVTGATDGIGVTTAKNLARLHFDVLIHGRDEQRIQKARETVQSFVGSDSRSKIVTLPAADLSTVQGARTLASDVVRTCQEQGLDLKVVLMNNAGVFSKEHVVTSEGTELTFAVNVVAPFVITSRLLPLLLEGNEKRIVIASSISQCSKIRDWDDMAYQRRSYSAHSAYSESKLLDAMLTVEFAERFKSHNIGTDRLTVNCLDPGTVNTKMLYQGVSPVRSTSVVMRRARTSLLIVCFAYFSSHSGDPLESMWRMPSTRPGCALPTKSRMSLANISPIKAKDLPHALPMTPTSADACGLFYPNWPPQKPKCGTLTGCNGSGILNFIEIRLLHTTYIAY